MAMFDNERLDNRWCGFRNDCVCALQWLKLMAFIFDVIS